MRDITIEIKHQTIVICAIIIFLIVDLYLIDKIIVLLFQAVSNVQSVTTGMTALNKTTASTYTAQGVTNQEVYIGMGICVLIFFGYISKETMGLLGKIIESEKNANTKHNEHTDDKRPK
ncbi:MAG: hypothetical protein ACYCO0_02630 [Candidatus Micrarchaeaceae archaeon]